MKEFKGTKGEWTPVYSSGCCIGVGVEIAEGYHEMVSNTILPETDQEYELTKHIIIADAKLQAAAPDLLDACLEFIRKVDAGEAKSTRSYQQMKAAISKALNH